MADKLTFCPQERQTYPKQQKNKILTLILRPQQIKICFWE